MRYAFHPLAAAALVAAAVCATPAGAQTTWTYSTFSTTDLTSMSNSFSSTQGGVKLTVTGYSTAITNGAGSTFANANVANYGTGSGFGVRNQIETTGVTTPQHSMDNFAGTDMLALNFTSVSTSAAVSMVLTQLATGWHNTSTTSTCTSGTASATCGTDSDISLLRYDGSGTPTIAGQTIAQLLSSGWTLVNDYSDMVDDTSRNTGLSSASKGSSWWLISAYNSAWDGGTGKCTTATGVTDCTKLSNGDDFVKVLSSVTAAPRTPTAASVPEPGTLAMAGLALATVFTTRRKRAPAAA